MMMYGETFYGRHTVQHHIMPEIVNHSRSTALERSVKYTLTAGEVGGAILRGYNPHP